MEQLKSEEQALEYLKRLKDKQNVWYEYRKNNRHAYENGGGLELREPFWSILQEILVEPDESENVKLMRVVWKKNPELRLTNHPDHKFTKEKTVE